MMAGAGGGVALRKKNRNLIQHDMPIHNDEVMPPLVSVAVGNMPPMEELSPEEQFKLSKKLFAEQLKQELLYGKKAAKPQPEAIHTYDQEEEDEDSEGQAEGESYEDSGDQVEGDQPSHESYVESSDGNEEDSINSVERLPI